jgi:glycosyltransferase involved in cell wall biosynthesis
MPAASHNPLRPFYTGLYFDEHSPQSAWLRDRAVIMLPPLAGISRLRLKGEFLPHPEARGCEFGCPGLSLRVGKQSPRTLQPKQAGVWCLEFELSPEQQQTGLRIEMQLKSVGLTNFLAWLGRISAWGPLQRFRKQTRNRQLRISSIETDEGIPLCDFSRRGAAFSTELLRSHLKIGMNIVGFLCADLGIGESARCMVRAADAAAIPSSLVALKLHCKNPQGDKRYAARLQDDNPHPVNVIHIDPPVARDIDHHHGRAFREGRYNIAYWAWELPDFPDAWVEACRYFDEIWCPSDFVREAVALKSPLPVLTMPHAIAFEEPRGVSRSRFGLSDDEFVFLFAYDLNSYSERKNPKAVLEAFRRSGLAGKGASLAIKIHNMEGNVEDYDKLREAVADLPGTRLIAETLSREDFYRLEAASDCFVSLHRSEGFGLALAECMKLSKPVISTNWSATAEYLNENNGCPVNFELRTLERNYGPYTRGSHWAEPDTEHAAWWMRRLFEDRGLAAKLGAAAKATMEERFSPSVIGTRYRRRLEALALAP